MKTKILLFVCCLLALPLSSLADGVSEGEALQQAERFLVRRGLNPAKKQLRPVALTPDRRAAGGVTPYYIFNVGQDEGFVIVSGDDAVLTPVLGYATQGAIDVSDMPQALRCLLDDYAAQTAMLSEHPQTPQVARRAARAPVYPLVASHWNQGSPYNLKCPEITYTDAESVEHTKRAVTGCVATSMAQVMNYYQHPDACTQTIPAYTTRTRSIEVSELSPVSFDWPNMLSDYGSSATDTQKDAVATLMQYCGSSLQMNYNISSFGSSAYNAAVAESLKQYFGYSNDAQVLFRYFYSYTEWISLLYNELAAARPVILGGQSVDGGHSFVCDGYATDDYFHINWGWGGSSDGYYRLAMLDPSEQGIGGSTTADGYSFGQEAVVGIHPAENEETPVYALSLEDGVQFGSSDGENIKQFLRASSEDAFTGISLYFTLWHYVFGKTSFDYAVQLIDAGGQCVQTLASVEGASMSFNTKTEVTLSDLSVAADVPDGTYALRVVSRENGQAEWQDCYGTDRSEIEAVIDGNNLTLTAPRLLKANDPTLVSITPVGTPTVGTEAQLTVRLRGANADYHGDLYLYLGDDRVMGRQADIPAGQEVDVTFCYVPTTAGSNTVSVRTNSQSLGSAELTVSDSDSRMDVELTPSVTFHNLSDGKFYGGGIRATITLTNSSADYSYAGQMNCSLRTWDGESYSGTVTHYNVVVPKNGSLDVPFAVDGLELGTSYSIRITYYTSSEGKKVLAANDCLTEKYVMGEGYLLCDAQGTTTIHPKSAVIAAGDARYLDMTAISDWTGVSVTPSTNPNCLYLLSEGAATPASLVGCNVVKGAAADQITLTDGHDFFTPITFTATTISYTRQFSLAANGSSGWNTIVLPFTVASVTAGGQTVDWFRSASDTGKNFWLKTFTGDGDGHVYFDFADAMTAGTPYIIAVPDDRWGAAWQMTGKDVVFTGADATVSPSQVTALSDNEFKFCGATYGQTLTDAYVLNNEGSKFKKQASTTVEPFRAWMETANISSLTATLSIASGTPGTTSLSPVPTAAGAPAVAYDLQGRRLDGAVSPSAPIVIKNGKKYIRRQR